jgi:flagellar L-ring protein precursor FlgH
MPLRNMNRSLLPFTAVALLCSTAAHAGSLWIKESNNETGLFADRRAKRVGDILTIVVQENVTATNTTDIKTSRENTPSAAGSLATNLINQFLGGIPSKIFSSKKVPLPNGQIATIPGVKPPTLTTDGKDDYHYGGTATSAQTISSRASVTVVDVLPNGNLVLEGTRLVTGNREKICAYIRGIVRAIDVQKDNTVLSSTIADLDLQFVPEGSLSDVRKGWLQRLNEKIRPY